MGWKNQGDRPNIWQTFIECILIKNNTEMAFLATNCRAENVVSEGPIFGGKLADASVIKGWDKDIIIRAGVGIYHPFRIGLSEKVHYGEYNGGVKVILNKRPVKVWAVEEVTKTLQEGRENNFFYWSIKYTNNGDNYELITLCKYINFSPIQSNNGYIQVISGYVISEDCERFFISYVCANITNEDKVNAEILKRTPIYIFDAKLGFCGRGTQLLGSMFLPLKWLFLTDEFCESTKVDAEIAIFTYE